MSGLVVGDGMDFGNGLLSGRGLTCLSSHLMETRVFDHDSALAINSILGCSGCHCSCLWSFDFKVCCNYEGNELINVDSVWAWEGTVYSFEEHKAIPEEIHRSI